MRDRNNNIHVILLVLGVMVLAYLYGQRTHKTNSLPAGFPVPENLKNYDSPIATPMFDGSYALLPKESFSEFRNYEAKTPQQLIAAKKLLAFYENQYRNFKIKHGIITCGKLLVQEFRITSATQKNGLLTGKAIFHEDIHDPGDCFTIAVQLKLEKDKLFFYFYELNGKPGKPIVFRRQKNEITTSL